MLSDKRVFLNKRRRSVFTTNNVFNYNFIGELCVNDLVYVLYTCKSEYESRCSVMILSRHGLGWIDLAGSEIELSSLK